MNPTLIKERVFFLLQDTDIWWRSTVIGGIAILFFFLWKMTSNNKNQSQQMNDKISNNKPLLNVFDVSKKSQTILSSQKANFPNDKPFSSSYYYAHNNPNAKGGYKDGLLMEDYVMNQPKLLSKNGVPLTTESSPELKPPSEKRVISSQTTNITVRTNNALHSVAMNRYLWDDDGNSEGTAKLYFDTLPLKSGSIQWKDAGISAKEVKLKLFQTESSCSLLLQIKSLDEMTSTETRYHFYVSQLYGPVKEAQVVVKSKHLIVKLWKEKKGKGYRVAWPQVHAKGVPMNDYIDMDLFLEER